MPRTIVLVACVSKKRPEILPARELYCSDWFIKARRYAESLADEWFILSAKYGLLHPHQVIEPYNETLKKMGKRDRLLWSEKVMEDLKKVLQPGDRVIFLAGKDYREHLTRQLEKAGFRVTVPMEGLGIGEQLSWLKEAAMVINDSSSRLSDVQRFYDLLSKLEQKLGGARRLSNCNGRMDWPERGVYFFFEPSEERSTSGKGLRLVRVGTHGLSEGSKSTLWQRLSQHQGSLRSGGGNHRGSIFRLHIGTALIARDYPDGAGIRFWGQGSSAPADIRLPELPIERHVSSYLRDMPFLWLGISDAPGRNSLRGYIERNTIALFSNAKAGLHPINPPSANWLGRWAASSAIRRSGLWHINHVDENYAPGFLDLLEQKIAAL